MKAYIRIRGTRRPGSVDRSTPANVKASARKKAKGYSHVVEANPGGPSDIERGHIAEMDVQSAQALRVAIDDAIRGVADRFDLNYRVLRGEFGADGAVYRIGLEVKERPRTVHVSGRSLIVPSSTPGKALGSARLPGVRPAAAAE